MDEDEEDGVGKGLYQQQDETTWCVVEGDNVLLLPFPRRAFDNLATRTFCAANHRRPEQLRPINIFDLCGTLVLPRYRGAAHCAAVVPGRDWRKRTQKAEGDCCLAVKRYVEYTSCQSVIIVFVMLLLTRSASAQCPKQGLTHVLHSSAAPICTRHD